VTVDGRPVPPEDVSGYVSVLELGGHGVRLDERG
jgi:hypothetical protein